jgi:hypothetical protein
MSSHEDRRGAPRVAVSLDARLIYNNGRASLDCRIVDLSTTGAKLDVDERMPVPPHFDLAIDSQGVQRSARLAWRAGRGVGVAFIVQDVKGAGGFGRRSQPPPPAPASSPQRPRFGFLRALLDRREKADAQDDVPQVQINSRFLRSGTRQD